MSDDSGVPRFAKVLRVILAVGAVLYAFLWWLYGHYGEARGVFMVGTVTFAVGAALNVPAMAARGARLRPEQIDKRKFSLGLVLMLVGFGVVVVGPRSYSTEADVTASPVAWLITVFGALIFVAGAWFSARAKPGV